MPFPGAFLSQIQILDEVICVSFSASVLGKGITSSLLSVPQLWVNSRTYLSMITDLEEGKTSCTLLKKITLNYFLLVVDGLGKSMYESDLVYLTVSKFKEHFCIWCQNLCLVRNCIFSHLMTSIKTKINFKWFILGPEVKSASMQKIRPLTF